MRAALHVLYLHGPLEVALLWLTSSLLVAWQNLACVPQSVVQIEVKLKSRIRHFFKLEQVKSARGRHTDF